MYFMDPPEVFLGGECGTSTWRRDIAIPRLQAAGLTYYNPQVPEGQWHAGLIPIETEAKKRCRQLLIVVGPSTRGTATLLEAAEYVCYGSLVHLVIDDIPPGTVIDGVEVRGRDLKDANRARAYLRGLVADRRPHVPIHGTVTDAVESVIAVASAFRVR